MDFSSGKILVGTFVALAAGFGNICNVDGGRWVILLPDIVGSVAAGTVGHRFLTKAKCDSMETVSIGLCLVCCHFELAHQTIIVVTAPACVRYILFAGVGTGHVGRIYIMVAMAVSTHRHIEYSLLKNRDTMYTAGIVLKLFLVAFSACGRDAFLMDG